MSVVIEPSEQLEFHRPFTRTSKESLHVKNPGTEPIIFKVKTTAPKQYCVRPNAGRIEPNSEIEVQIILQPFKEELPEDYKCKDKFLVQTAPINASFEQQDITSMWSHVETNERGSMHQHKIKCAFVGPKEDEQVKEPTTIASSSVIEDQPITVPATATAIPVAAAAAAAAPITTSAVPTQPAAPAAPAAPTAPTAPTAVIPEATPVAPAASVAPAVPATPAAPAVATAAPPVPPVQTRAIPTEKPSLTTPPTLPPTSTTIASEKKPSPPSITEKELKDALEKIAQLEKELNELRKEEGLRVRNGRKLAPTVQPLDAVHQHLAALETPRPTEGYPPQVVMGVALLVFIFTYLFF